MKTFDLIEFAAEITRTSMPDGYDKSVQQYRDFRAVFFEGNASESQGRRVLAQIFAWGGLWSSVAQIVPDEPTDIHATMVAAGAQDLSKRILMALTVRTEEQDA